MTQSTKKVSSIAAAIGVLLVAIWYVGLFRPQSANLKKTNAAYASAQAQEATLQTQIQQLQALLRQVPQDTAELALLNKAVPKSPSLQDILDQLHSLAVSAGVQLTSVSPSLPGTSNGAASTAGPASPVVQLSLSLTGTYGGIRSFLIGLSTMQRVVVVTQLSIGGTNGALSATIAAHAFYNP